ncbi:NAD(P)/FAD-dependent oxidoreductase [Micromonospora sp. RTP1Z1]|uniref:FAD-dependent oxidoreductase n=1 Tax=Micromonospora sp. RTP1Z1 TaxID=2994043 RepID=UPI0029C75764|nr:NAD(P)/FAD-dependent oxidoreductase [Micromonospora sp. RTP1Z1]
MAKVKTALVIGGGIAGPVTALALHKAGIEATVYDAYARPADGIGGIFMVAPNGLEALRIIGADDAVRAIGQPIQRMVIGDGRGRRFGEFANLPGQPGLAMWRHELLRVLHEHALASGIKVEFGKRLVGVDETPSGVTARFADGSTASADVLIGADGIRSTVRKLIDPAAPDPRYVGLLGMGGLADGEAPGEPDAMYFAFGKRAFFGYWTGPTGRTMWFSNLPSEQPMTMAQARDVPPTEWLQRLQLIHTDDMPAHDVLQHANADELIVIGSLEILPTVPRWHRGRMVLVGDSAHAPSSSSGQGASLAIESAIQVARCLRDLPDAPTAFAAYERLRRDRVEKIAENAMKNNRQKAFGPVGSAMMSVLMPLAMKTFLKPKKMFGPVHGYRIDWNDTVTT